MYLLKVLVEMPTHSLDKTFDYLSNQEVKPGVRVNIFFNRRNIVGYVLGVEHTEKSKKQLEEAAGFKYAYISSVIDEAPLLNEELQKLSSYLSKVTLSPRIACLQAMLPVQLKPSSSKASGIKTQLAIKVIDNYAVAKTKKQQECLDYLKENDDIFLKDSPYSRVLISNLEKQGIIELYEKEVLRNPYGDEISKEDFPLTDLQQKVFEGIKSKLGTYNCSLIYGVTGSGKTEVYLQLSRQVIKENKTVLMLVPEISLTPMMVRAYKSRFGDKVAILHSRLSNGERYDEYRRIRNNEVAIVVGARSAIFAPLENIGLIILDEEHDSSYKQESTPRYDTKQIARVRAKYHQASLVLGSATPSLESHSKALNKEYDLFEMPKRINNFQLPKVDIVNMESEMRKGNYSNFSNLLKERIASTLDRDEQVILLLNKRGYSSFVRCRDCSEVIKCPHCDVTLTYHKTTNSMKCHYCDYSAPYPTTCPNCHGHDLKATGTGTQKVAEQLEQTFKNAKVIRYDVDSTRNKAGHQKLLDQFERKEGNILLGTQMIAKGLDFENVTFVGVINADQTLNIPDYRSNERTFQLLSQVAGRSGRHAKEGSVVIQTYNPDHFVFKAVLNHDYLSFYREEMEYRKLAVYPPYVRLVSILIQGRNELDVTNESIVIKNELDRQLNNVRVLGPSESMIYKLNDNYRKRILIKYVSTKEVYTVLNNINEYYNRQGRKVSVVCDFNPYSQI